MLSKENMAIELKFLHLWSSNASILYLAKTMIENLQNFYLQQNEPNKSCLLALRSIILNLSPLMTETVKYGMPCFCYKEKRFCYVWTDKKNQEPYILMVDGNLLDHPELEQGKRLKMKILRVNPNLDLPLSIILKILKSALALHEANAVA
jgi:hypothetical protein